MPEQKNKPKAGVKSTEFWATSIVAVLVSLAPILGAEIAQEDALAMSAGLVAIYSVGRTIVKALTR